MQYAEAADQVRTFVLEHGVVDASLLGLAIPYALVTSDDVRMQASVARIEADLHRKGGGLHRYAWDSLWRRRMASVGGLAGLVL